MAIIVTGLTGSLVERVEQARRWIDSRTGGALTIIGAAFRQFGSERAAEGAASMAYYAFFSLFPLLLFLVASGGFLLESEQAYDEVVRFVSELFPLSQPLIERNIQQAMDARGPVGAIGLVGLLWSGLSFFGILSFHVARAWSGAERRNFLQQRLVAVKMVGGLAVLLLLSLTTNALASVLPHLRLPFLGGQDLFNSPAWTLFSKIVPGAVAFAMFLSLYRWVPNTRVRWKGAVWGAAVAAIAWELAAAVLSWYVSSGLVHYELVYGSLGTVAVLMLWIYVSLLITLFGAHLTASINNSDTTNP